MIRLSRISAIFFRHLWPTLREPIRITDMFYWPFVDMALFGLLAIYSQQASPNSEKFIISLLVSIMCWFLIYRSSLEITRNLLVEIWDNHMMNLFSTPISINEFVLALMGLGIVQSLVTFFYSIFVVWFLYSYNLLYYLFLILPFVPLFISVGWIIGIFVASLIFYFGKNVEVLVWSIPWFFAIISGAYYSVDLFPAWLQRISFCFPAAWLFRGLRATVSNRSIDFYGLTVGLLLCLVYLMLSYTLLQWSFKQSTQKGLSRLD